MKNTGFTLVELAIVIVIIGLLVTGVMQGAELIKQARLQGIMKDIENYKSSSLTFKSKYGSLPGDIKNATMFFPAASNCTTLNGDLGNATCNGNGDGLIGPGSSQYEYQYFWKDLELAKLIKGTYTGLPGSLGTMDAVIGVNVPSTSISGVGITIESSGGYQSGYGWLFDGYYDNVFTLGTENGIWDTSSPFLSPQDSYALDLKYDDGIPGTGKIKAKVSTNCITGSSTQPATSTYKLTYTKDDACGFYIDSGLN